MFVFSFWRAVQEHKVLFSLFRVGFGITWDDTAEDVEGRRESHEAKTMEIA